MSHRTPLLVLSFLAAACDGGGGADAGGLDAAGLDAGDVRVDAGEVDAGARDAGTTRDDAGDTDAGPPPEPGPRWIGRHDASDPSAVRMSWSGSGLVVRFRGSGARVTMNGTGRFFTVIVDGEVQPTLAVSGASGTYELASGLADGEHTVELHRRTEGSFGATVISGVEVDGELLAVPPPTRSIEIVGDSISAGYGVDGDNEFCNFSADTENHFLTYGAVAARALGAELSTVAWSGKGVIFNYDTDTWEPMPEIYGRVIADEDGSTGTIREVDAVVVNLGSNDFSTGGDPTEEQFVPAYVGLLEQIRAQHPGAMIFCTIGPPLGGGDGDRAESYIASAIAMRGAAGDARVRWIPLDGFADWGCDYHPGDETQALLAEDLVAALRAQLGW